MSHMEMQVIVADVDKDLFERAAAKVREVSNGDLQFDFIQAKESTLHIALVKVADPVLFFELGRWFAIMKYQ